MKAHLHVNWYLSPNSLTFTEGWKANFSKRAVFSKVRKYNRDQMDYFFCVHISITILFENIKQILTSLNVWTYIFSIENIRRHIWKPCTYTFSPYVISKCLRIPALVLSIWLIKKPTMSSDSYPNFVSKIMSYSPR